MNGIMKKKIPFDISYREKIESGEVSVVTRDDRLVRIICWDTGMEWSICALIKDHDPKSTYGFPQLFDKEGKCIAEDGKDLFLLVEDELTEFEERLGQIMIHTWDITKECQECQADVDDIKQWAAELLEAARKELRPEFDKELEQAYKNQDDVVYQRGYDAGFAAGSEIDEERLTDKIAEKVAERVVKDGNPFAPDPVVRRPWIAPGPPYEPITVMYGVTPTEFRPITGDPLPGAIGTGSSATTEKYNETEE